MSELKIAGNPLPGMPWDVPPTAYRATDCPVCRGRNVPKVVKM